jgi:hypothetical protein
MERLSFVKKAATLSCVAFPVSNRPGGLLARWQIVKIVVGHGILSGPKRALVAKRTFVFLNGGRLPARLSQSVERMPLVHRVIDLRDRPELGITG